MSWIFSEYSDLALPIPTFSETKSACDNLPAMSDIRPWTNPLLGGLEDWPDVEALNHHAQELLPGFPWRFIRAEKPPSRAKSRGMASLSGYVELISAHGKIPMRQRNLHDLLNALSFFRFPASKQALNERHLAESPEGVKPGQNRTRVQDLLTMFDEGGVIRMVARSGHHKDLVFGHAIHEHMIVGKQIRAARLDFYCDVDILSISPGELTKMADHMFCQWLKNKANCLDSGEFSHVWIPTA